MNKIKTIIFDFDGVIANTIPFTLEKTVKILKDDFSVKLTKSEIINIIRSKSFKEIISELKIPLFKLPFIIRKIGETQEELNKIIKSIAPHDQIKALLINLKNHGFNLVVISSNLEKNVRKFLKINKIEYFSYLNCGSHILGKSQEIKMFLKKNHLKNDEVIYVGDEIRDIEACIKADIKIISVTWGLNTAKALRDHGANYIVKKPKDILRIVCK